jgi:hypothetical protein
MENHPSHVDSAPSASELNEMRSTMPKAPFSATEYLKQQILLLEAQIRADHNEIVKIQRILELMNGNDAAREVGNLFLNT